MKLRIVKNSLTVFEKMEEVEILPIWSNQVAKNFETKLWIRKGTLSLERICDFQFMYIIWFFVVYLTYFMKPVKETTFSSNIHKRFLQIYVMIVYLVS